VIKLKRRHGGVAIRHRKPRDLLTAAQRRVYFDRPRGACRLCGKPVAPPKRNWCGQACVDEWQVITSQSFARHQVRKRDKCICALCGADGRKIKRVRRHVIKLTTDRPLHADLRRHKTALRELLSEWGFPMHRRHFTDTHTWQADHIVPVCQGGAALGLANLRTLCLPCHKAATAALAARLAESRRDKASRPVSGRNRSVSVGASADTSPSSLRRFVTPSLDSKAPNRKLK
jgi:5-methylcytosine-specific restriction enzyme A